MVDLENYKSFKKEIIEGLSINGLTKYEFSNGINIAFGRVVLKRDQDGMPLLYLDEFCNKEQMKKWNNSAGHILYKDIKKNNLDCYYELVLPGYKVLLRSISENEIEEFENNEGLVDNIFKVNDLNFLITKIIEINSSYSIKELCTTSYFDEIDDESNNTEENEYEEIEDESELTSLSLFED